MLMVDLFAHERSEFLLKSMAYAEKDGVFKELITELFHNLVVKLPVTWISNQSFEEIHVTDHIPFMRKWHACKSWRDVYALSNEIRAIPYHFEFLMAIRRAVKQTLFDAPVFLHWISSGMVDKRPMLSQPFTQRHYVFFSEPKRTAYTHAVGILSTLLCFMDRSAKDALHDECMCVTKTLLSFVNREDELETS